MKITEEQGAHKEWYAEAKSMTLESYPQFLEKLVNKYHHDYGTICHALASAAVAAANAINKSPAGGITGFQGGAVMWEFIKHWGAMGVNEDTPMSLITYDKLLYPQYECRFRTISKETWDWCQKRAGELLKEKDASNMSGRVRDHWKNVKSGKIPFGLTIRD